ncbi:MAG: SpoIIE family protein phosphatase, partial [Phycisphaerales bacterium]|nr:SpoIIE family protein phosphatase [Phycisphaerales bacterium]
AAVAIDRARLVEEIRRQHVVQASLNIAREVQRSFMPDAMPKIAGYDLATWWFPNEAVGGDYCDVVQLGDGRWGLVMADVSGHGLGPSLIMASVRAALRALMLEHWSTIDLLTLLGRSLAADLRTERFITINLLRPAPVDDAEACVLGARRRRDRGPCDLHRPECPTPQEYPAIRGGASEECQGPPLFMAFGWVHEWLMKAGVVCPTPRAAKGVPPGTGSCLRVTRGRGSRTSGATGW